MIFICTRDARLTDACGRLSAGGEETGAVADVDQLQRQAIHAGDLIIVDLKTFPEGDLPDVACPVVALAETPHFRQALRLLRRGVRGYGNRYMRPENLKQAAAAVRAGQVWMPPAIISRMINTFSPAEPEPAEPLSLDQLSKREREVADLVARGLSNKELADQLYISVRTVKAHLTSIFSKTGVRDRLALAVKMKK